MGVFPELGFWGDALLESRCGIDLPPAFVHVRIRQVTTALSPVRAGMGVWGKGPAFEASCPSSAL